MTTSVDNAQTQPVTIHHPIDINRVRVSMTVRPYINQEQQTVVN